MNFQKSSLLIKFTLILEQLSTLYKKCYLCDILLSSLHGKFGRGASLQHAVVSHPSEDVDKKVRNMGVKL